MKFKEWKEWYKSLPKGYKWFVWLILLRPLIDNFYYLKEISPFLSPLYIVGLLTPIAIFYSVRNKKKPLQTDLDTNFRLWGGIVIAGIIFMAFTGIFTLPFWIVSLKISAPIYLFIFFRYFIRSRKDLDGVLQTFLYSSLVIICIFSYETIVHPLNLVHTRGIERYQGSYADVFNYAIYVSFSTIINYYFLLSPHSTLSRTAKIRNVVINLVVATAMLIKMSHVATDVVFLAINAIYFLVAFRRNAASAIIIVIVIAGIVYSYDEETIDNNIMPLIQTDVNVYAGEEDDAYYLHGRVGRWERITGIFNESPLFCQLFGLPFTGANPYAFLTGGVHSDYLRNLICAGYVGLIIYLIFLYNLFRRILKHLSGMLYLGLATLSSLLLYSVSVTPTVYPSFLYIVMSIFAFFAIPKNVLVMSEKNKVTRLAA